MFRTPGLFSHFSGSRTSNRLPALLSMAAVVAAVAVVVLVGLVEDDWGVAAVLAGGLLGVGLMLLVVRRIAGRLRERRGAAIASAMSRKFAEGIEQFRATGKDLGQLPWYVLVGEPGAGKTEAIRHANIPSPRGFNAPRQGEGGTLMMDWWFTNSAVLLDTAGRVMFEGGADWKEFLRQLKKARPNCPINGMVLAIPVTSLLLDTADQILLKATTIAGQFDAVQRALGVRFPVYVVVTKADMVTGFREFFEGLDEPAACWQMLGWSNPEPLDRPFQPQRVDEYLQSLKATLKRRRLALLRAPGRAGEADEEAVWGGGETGDEGRDRLDRVDALYAFPDAMASIGSRLRLYLETIFTPSAWVSKPLFVRGIYFTCSMRQGKVLHEDLARALGKSPEELPAEGRRWDQNKSYFLRDVFVEKAFPERGLVTTAGNVARQQKLRRRVGATAGTLAAAAIATLSLLGYRELQESVGRQARFFNEVLARVSGSEVSDLSNLSSLRLVADDHGKVVYRGSEPAVKGGLLGGATVAQVQKRNLELAKSQVRSSPVFAVWARSTADLNDAKWRAHQRIFDEGVLQPLTTLARRRVADPRVWTASASDPAPGEKPTAALSELLMLGSADEGRTKLPAEQRKLAALAALVLPEAPPAPEADVAESAYAYFHPPQDPSLWAPAAGFDGSAGDARDEKFWSDVDKGVRNFIEFGNDFVGARIHSVGDVATAARSYGRKESAFHAAFVDEAGNRRAEFPPTDAGFQKFARTWGERLAALTGNAEPLRKALDEVPNRMPGADPHASGLKELLRQAGQSRQTVKPAYDLLRRSLGSEPGGLRFTTSARRPVHAPAIQDQLVVATRAFDNTVASQLAEVGNLPLEQLDADFLGRSAPTSVAAGTSEASAAKWRFEARLSAYALTKDELSAPATAPREAGEIAAQLDAAESLTAAFTKALAFGWDPGPSPSAQEKQAGDTIRAAAGYTAAWRRSAVWSAGLAAARTPADPVPARSAEDSVTAVPFTEGWSHSETDPRYRPALAAAFLQSWRPAAKKWKETKGQPRKDLFDADGHLTAAFEAAARHAEEYKEAYATNWSVDVPKKLTLKLGSWQEFVEGTRGSGGAGIDSRLDSFATQVNDALTVLSGDPPQLVSPDVLAQPFRASVSLSKVERDKGAALVANWKKLGADAPTAKRSLALLPTSAVRPLFDVPGGAATDTAPAGDDPAKSSGTSSTTVYWSSLTSTFLDLLSGKSDSPVSEQLLAEVDRRCRFPLPHRKGDWSLGDSDLDPAALADLVEQIQWADQLRRMPAAAPDDRELAKLGPAAPRIAAALAALRGTFSQADVQWLDTLGGKADAGKAGGNGLIDALLRPFDVEIAVLGAGAIPRNGPAGPPLRDNWFFVKLRQQGTPADGNRNGLGLSTTKELGHIGLIAPPTWLEFTDAAAGAGTGNIFAWGTRPGELSQQWPAIGLLRAAADVRWSETEPNTCLVCLMIPASRSPGAAKSPFWLRLKFTDKEEPGREFPHWPVH